MGLFLAALVIVLAKAALFLAMGLFIAVAEQVFRMLREGRPIVSVWPDEEESDGSVR